MYESPIHLQYGYTNPQMIQQKLVRDEEAYIVKCCVNMGIAVDRDELVKALQYDRGQYEKGFEDGRAEGYRAGVEESRARFLSAITKLMDGERDG